ncbi:hypothetical protein T12_6431, partial [Trichinella patagoniensis]
MLSVTLLHTPSTLAGRPSQPWMLSMPSSVRVALSMALVV